jgi:hypothetical protein
MGIIVEEGERDRLLFQGLAGEPIRRAVKEKNFGLTVD